MGTDADFVMPEGADPASTIPSPDATRVAYAVRGAPGHRVEINGEPGPTCVAVSGLTFSPDSSAVAYKAQRDRSLFIVSASAEWGPYEEVGVTSPVISPDSQHMAYHARHGRKWSAFVDGAVVGGPYEAVMEGGVLFSPDSRRLAYGIEDGRAWRVVADGDESEAFTMIVKRSLTFSPDSRKLAYGAIVRERGLLSRRMEVGVVVNGALGAMYEYVEGKGFGLLGEIVFSPDSQRIAYGVARGGKYSWVIDGVEGRPHDGLIAGWPPDGQCVGYPDHGKHAWRDESLVFSPDSRHFAYAAVDAGAGVVVHDGQERARHAGIMNVPIRFSPNSGRIAYAAVDQGQCSYVVDWEPLAQHQGLSSEAAFSPDSSRFAYVALEDDDTFSLVAGSRKWQLPAVPLPGARVVWDDADSLHTLVTDDRRVWVVRYDAH